MELITTNEQFEKAFAEAVAVVFKHSASCGISTRARAEVERFVSDHPEQPVYMVEVVESRRVSNRIEDATGVRHESPQVLVTKNGHVVWHASHLAVTAEAIAAALG